MSDFAGRDYFDARFDGLEKLMNAQSGNLRGHIVSVSEKLKGVEHDLAEHKESVQAHGLESSRNSASIIASWLGLAVAAGVGLMEFVRRNK